MKQRVTALAWLLLLCACRGPGSSQPARHVVPDTAAAANATRIDATLLVAPMTAVAFYDTQQIVFSRTAGTRAYYQFSSWTEPPSRRLASLLVSRFERAGSFRTVVLATSGVRGSLLLRMHLDEIYHDATMPPGVARVTLTAELSDLANGLLLGRNTFSAAAQVTSYDADGAVQGLRQAMATLLDDVSIWAIATAAKQAFASPPSN